MANDKKDSYKFEIPEIKPLDAASLRLPKIDFPAIDISGIEIPTNEESSDPFEISNHAIEIADKIDDNFNGQLWEKAKQFALQRGSNTVDESDIQNAYKMIAPTPLKSKKIILSRVATRIGVFIGGIMFVCGLDMASKDASKYLLIGGGLLVAILCALLEEFIISRK